MAEEIQPTKRHKSSEIHTQNNIPQASPIGDELDTQLLNPIGEEELKLDGNKDDNSEEERNPFLDTDVCKTLDDHLILITNKLPGLDHLSLQINSLGQLCIASERPP